MITTALLGLALLAPADTPIEPIDVDTFDVGRTLPEADAACSGTAQLGEAIDAATPLVGAEFAVLLEDMAVAFYAEIIEDGMGENRAFSLEAEALYENWITGCLSGEGS